MMNKQHKYNRVEYLTKTYKDTNIAKGEKLTKETKSKINKRYYQKVRKRMVQNVLNETNTTTLVEIEVMHIVEKIDNLKSLCPRCSEEQIVAVIILYIQRNYNKRLKEENTRLWKKYDLSWKLHSRIVSNMLRQYRKDIPLPRNVN